MDGLLVIDKPVGPTSHDVVAIVRRATGEPRIGHTGTLDPGAGGVLPLVVGRATRLARFLSAADKTYEAVIRLGIDTDTYDSAGEPSALAYEGPWPRRDQIDRILDEFRGTFLQQPPLYSAKKMGGRPSHRLARAASRSPSGAGHLSAAGAGIPLSARPALPAPVRVTAHAVDIVSVDGDHVTLRVDCSAGFYLRSLAHDLGKRLGTGAHLTALRRTRSGDLTLTDAVALEAVQRHPAAATAALIPLRGMLSVLTPLRLTDEGARRARQGRDLGAGDFLDPVPPVPVDPLRAPRPGRGVAIAGSAALLKLRCFRLLDRAGDLIGVAEPAATPGLLHPSVVLV